MLKLLMLMLSLYVTVRADSLFTQDFVFYEEIGKQHTFDIEFPYVLDVPHGDLSIWFTTLPLAVDHEFSFSFAPSHTPTAALTGTFDAEHPFTAFNIPSSALSEQPWKLNIRDNSFRGYDLPVFLEKLTLTYSVPEPSLLWLFGIGAVLLGINHTRK